MSFVILLKLQLSILTLILFFHKTIIKTEIHKIFIYQIFIKIVITYELIVIIKIITHEIFTHRDCNNYVL